MELLKLNVLLLDEVSMIDDACFSGICNVLSIIDHTRRPDVGAADCFGPVHLLLFGGSRVSLFIKCMAFLFCTVQHHVPASTPLTLPKHDQHMRSIDRKDINLNN